MSTILPTGRKEIPPRRRASKYDELLAFVDGECKVLPRGEFPGFGEQTSMDTLRGALKRWASSRGYEVEVASCWLDWRIYMESGEKVRVLSQYRIDGERVPWGAFITIRSTTASSDATLRLDAA